MLGPVVLFLLCCAALCCPASLPAPLFPSVLSLAFPWCSRLFLPVWCPAVVCLAVWRGALVRVSAALCRVCALVFLVVLCCVVCFVAVLLLLPASSAAVARCHGVLLGAVLCCRAVLPAVCCAVFLCALFQGASCRVLCPAVLPCLRSFSLCDAPLPHWYWLVPRPAVCCFRVIAVGSSCTLLSPGGVFWCRCPCLAVWPALLWFGVVWRGALLPGFVSCGAVLPCGGVLWCSAACLCCWLCLSLLFSFQNVCKTLKNLFPFSLFLQSKYTLPNTPARSKTMYGLSTYM